MNKIITTDIDLCVGCNRCVRECPMETANTTYQDEAGNIKVKIDHDKCVNCGRCITSCQHMARVYQDDCELFFSDLSDIRSGRARFSISLITAPSIRTNIPDYKRLFTYLKNLGVNKIYDVSLGADICTWAHVRHIEKTGSIPMITQPCPVIVTYCEKYRHDLLGYLSPIHSPMSCIAIYMKEYEGISDRIAALSPCIAKRDEFESTGLAQYNVTFIKLREYIERHGIELPEEETGFDHYESSIGSLFAMPGGLKENIEFYLDRKLHVTKAEGDGVFEKLDNYAVTDKALLPDVFDVLNCAEGCNIGSASLHEKSTFEVDHMMKSSREKALDGRSREYFKELYKRYDEQFDLSHFIREYHPGELEAQQITDEDIQKAFALLGKDDAEKQNVNCSACGSETCYQMARKIALGVNIPVNCIVKSMEDAKKEHKKNIEYHEKLATMEKMREADERVHVMLDTTPLSAMYWDKDLNIIDCNQEALKLFDINDKQVLLTRFNDFSPEFQPDGSPSAETAMKKVKEAFETGYVCIEWMHQTLEGDPRPVEVTLVRVDDKGEKTVMSYAADLREHKRMMHAVDRRDKLLQTVSRVADILLTTGDDTSIGDTITTSLELIGRAVDVDHVQIWKNVDVDGAMHYVNTYQWSSELGQAIKSVPPGLVFPYSEAPGWEKIFLRGDHINSSYHELPQEQKEFLAGYEIHSIAMIPLYLHEQFWGFFDLTDCHNERFFPEDEINILRSASLMMANALLRDENLRSIREAVEQARAANQAKSAFLSNMSHEIRTPMNAIIGITEIQFENEMLDSGVKEAFDKIYNSGHMLLSIINDLLDLSKIEAGKLELMVDNYEIASLINDSAQLNMMRIGSKPIEFKLEIDVNTPSVMKGDELRIKQILNNLLSNAFKYTEQGTVTLKVHPEPIDDPDAGDVTLAFRVSDTGQGMTSEQVAELFDEYARFNEQANKSTEGTGLGMSITQNLVRMMKGKIEVESEKGKGSTFTIRIPQGVVGSETLGIELVDNLQHFRSRGLEQMKRTQIKREPMPYGSVLVVDDVETNIYVAKGLLTPYALKIDSADSGFEAIEKIESGKTYSIIFMDHMMPKMDGIEATKILRNIGYKGCIVALTANALTGQVEQFLNNGFDDFISKPIDLRQLNAVLNKYIRDKRRQDIANSPSNTAAGPGEAPLSGSGKALFPGPDEAAFSMGAQRSGMDLPAGGPSPQRVRKPNISPRFAEVFSRDANKSINALEELLGKPGDYDADDLRVYSLNVHGMKSALAGIGVPDLSDSALKLEIAARNEDMGTIRNDTRTFIESLRELVALLAP